MTRPDHPAQLKILEYRAKKVEATEKAAAAKEPLMREYWESIAESYNDLAERLGRLSGDQ